MVSLILAAAFRAQLAQVLSGFVGRALGPPIGGPARLRFQTLSIREVSRRTGFPRSTLQDFIRDPTRARASTVDRITALVDDPRLQIRGRGVRTEYLDFPRATPTLVSNLVAPPDASAVRFISDQDQSPGRKYASSSWMDLDTFNDTAGALAASGMSTGGLVRIIYDTS